MRFVDVVLTVDPRSQAEIARECQKFPEGKGIDASVLSLYLNADPKKGRAIGAAHLAVLAEVLGQPAELLMTEISDQEIIDIAETKAKLQTQAAKSIATPPYPTPNAPATKSGKVKEPTPIDIYALAREAGLEIFADVAQLEGRERVPVYPERLACSPPDQLDASDEAGEIWLSLRRGKIHGAKAHAVRVVGPSMNQAGIEPGDILVVRRSSAPKDGQIVIAAHAGGVTIKRLRGRQLLAESDQPFTPIQLSEGDDDGDGNRLLGVVIGINKPTK